MNTSEKIVPAAIIAISVVIAGLSLRSGIVTFKEMDRKVSVKGLAEREVKADKVTWPLIYKEIGNDPSEMYDRLSSKNKRVIAFLKSAGIKDSDISVNPPVISDRQADNYGNEIMNYRYKATSVITVTSSEVDKVRQLMRRQSELMKQGIAIVSEEYGNNSITYEFTGLNKIKHSKNPFKRKKQQRMHVQPHRNLQKTQTANLVEYVMHNRVSSQLKTAMPILLI